MKIEDVRTVYAAMKRIRQHSVFQSMTPSEIKNAVSLAPEIVDEILTAMLAVDRVRSHGQSAGGEPRLYMQ